MLLRNLQLADFFDEDHHESILSRRQDRWAAEMFSNVRLLCCVAGAMNLVPKVCCGCVAV